MVSSSQSFFMNETAIIICKGYPGDPPQNITWIYNNTQPLGDFVRIYNNNYVTIEALIIENIQDSDAGDYICGYNSSIVGFIHGIITVNVVILPDSTFMIISPILSVLFVEYGDTLDIECLAEPDSPSLQYTWFTPDNEEIINQTLFLLSNNVDIGIYKCNVSSENNESVENSIVVKVINIPPLLPDNSEHFISSQLEGNDIDNLKIIFMLPPSSSNFSVQWEKLNLNIRNTLVNDLRFTKTLNIDTLILIIRKTRYSDHGNYSVTISNQYGNATVKVALRITKYIKTSVTLRFTDVTCKWIDVSFKMS